MEYKGNAGYEDRPSVMLGNPTDVEVPTRPRVNKER